MNELFDVTVEDEDRRKRASFWFFRTENGLVKAFAIGCIAALGLSGPVALLASRNREQKMSVEPIVPTKNASASTVPMGSSTTLVIRGANSKTGSGKKVGIVLPIRGIAPAGTTTSLAPTESSLPATTSSAAPAPPVVLTPTSSSVVLTTTSTTSSTTTTTIAPGSIPRTLVFSSGVASKTYGDTSFLVTASPSAGGGEISYSSSDTSICQVGTNSGEVTIIQTGTCSISATISASGNYARTTSSNSVSIRISKASLTITASSASIAYAPWLYVVTPSYKGFVYGENASVLTVLPTCAVLHSNGYDINSIDRRTFATTCSGAIATNYDISYIGGVLSVANWS